MSKVLVKATGSFMYIDKNGDCLIRVSNNEAISLRGLAESIEEIKDMLAVVYMGKMQVSKDEVRGGRLESEEKEEA